MVYVIVKDTFWRNELIAKCFPRQIILVSFMWSCGVIELELCLIGVLCSCY
jgi:hypothetical protein